MMKRIWLLAGLTVAIVWLWEGRMPALVRGVVSAYPYAAFDEETSPHFVCQGYTCVESAECGTSTCSSDQDCGGCNPDQRNNCPYDWVWLPEPDCQCLPPACNDWEVQECLSHEGAVWHDDGCWCDDPCANGNREIRLINTITDSWGWCLDCWTFCEESQSWYTYQEFCSDGQQFGWEWTERGPTVGPECHYAEWCYLECAL
jgi:hypothetical protein